MTDQTGYLSLALIVASMAGCTAAGSYFTANRTEPKVDPATECVRRAWNQADRIECLKNAPTSTRTTDK